MMKLYTSSGTCAVACDIALEEAGIPFERKMIKFDEGFLESPAFRKLNPNGAVPCLEIEPGVAIAEGSAILQYIAHKKPDAKLLPSQGLEHFRALEWLSFISTELHASTFGNLWRGEYLVEDKKAYDTFEMKVKASLAEKLKIVEAKLEGKTFCLGSQYTIVDAYLFTILGWSKPLEVDLTPYKNITGFQNRIFERPATQRTLKANDML